MISCWLEDPACDDMPASQSAGIAISALCRGSSQFIVTIMCPPKLLVTTSEPSAKTGFSRHGTTLNLRNMSMQLHTPHPAAQIQHGQSSLSIPTTMSKETPPPSNCMKDLGFRQTSSSSLPSVVVLLLSLRPRQSALSRKIMDCTSLAEGKSLEPCRSKT